MRSRRVSSREAKERTLTRTRFFKPLVATMAAAALIAGVTFVARGREATAALQYPVADHFLDGLAISLAFPGASPPGANRWLCRSTAHPRPVVLVHGTVENQTNNWQAASATLANNGYCVFSLNYGGRLLSPLGATGDIARSARELATFIDIVRTRTGAAEVDIVGHSQGGMMPRYYLKNLGGAAKVNTLVGLAPSSHGTDLGGLVDALAPIPGATEILELACEACSQQLVGSSFLTALNAGATPWPA